MELTRGKQAVRASLSVNSFQQKKRTTPIQDARFWCETGLDKNGFKKQYIDKDIGYGVFATTDFKQGQFLLEYVGSSICTKEAARRSRLYTRQNKSSLPRCYMYYFHFKGEERCIDATADTQRLAKFVNDAPLRNPKCNAKMKLVVFGGRPRLCLFALRDIKFGEEIRYDYGEDDRLLFWRSKATTTKPEGGKRKATEQEDSDDDPFDVEQERNQQQPKQHQTSDEHGIDISDEQYSDYGPEKSDCPSLNIEVLWRQENALDNTLLGKIGSNSLLKSSFFYLKNTLTDEIIDSYMSLIVRGRNVLYIDTITATNIFEGRLEKTNLLRNEIIEEYDVCFAVVNENGGHWVLLIILGKEREIIYVNPQGETESSVQDYCNHWHHFLESRSTEGLYDTHSTPWKMSTIDHTKQMDSISCGIFVLKFAEQYLEGKPLTIAGSIEQIRKEVGTKLLASLDAQSLDSNAGGTDTSCNPIATTERSKATAARGICRDNLVDISKLPKAKFGRTEELLCDICQKVFKKQGALTTHIKSHLKNTETYEKPKRPCPFCEKLQTQLRRHITSEHAEMPAVIEVMSFPENSKERRAGFDQLRKEGIDIYNRKQAAQEVPAYMAERKVDEEGSLVRCSKCKGYYKRTFFYRHKEICIGDDAQIPRKLEMSNRKVHSHDEEFQADILSRFHRDTVGNLCRTDDTLFVIGRRLFQVKKKRVDKDMEIRKSVMSDMRLLARVYIEFQEYNPKSSALEDMYLRENFSSLESAIENVTMEQDGKLKHGVKNSLYFLLRTSVDFLIGHHNINKNDKKVVELEKFIKTLEFHKDIVFGDAAYAIELSRLERLRVPENRLIDEDVEALRNHTLQVIKKITSTFTFIGVHEYVLLRDALCSRLTLYNARRGGEPSRLKILNFIEAKNKRWIDSDKVDNLPEWEKKLFQNHLITYQPGKGTHLVPVLIPQDCVDGLDILTCSETRQRAKIWKENSYLFPNTGFSADHTSGWNATHKLAKEAGVKRLDLVNATKQRHRISTLYCALEIPEKERQYFYKHMGHTKEVNWGTYQYPLPIMEITKVGKHLQDIDKGTMKHTNSSNSLSNEHILAHQPADEDDQSEPADKDSRSDELMLAHQPADEDDQSEPADKDSRSDELMLAHQPADEDDQSEPADKDSRSDEHMRAHQPADEDDQSEPADNAKNSDANKYKGSSQQDKESGSCQNKHMFDHRNIDKGVKSKQGDKEISSKTNNDGSGREYFKWTSDETESIKKAFKHWIEMPEGNTLPGTRLLKDYVEANVCRFTAAKLRVKIMNEQNKCQRLVKKRLINMA